MLLCSKSRASMTSLFTAPCLNCARGLPIRHHHQLAALLTSSCTLTWHHRRHDNRSNTTIRMCSSSSNNSTNKEEEMGYLDREIAAARRENRPYRLDKKRLTQTERQMLRLRSKAIPLVADHESVDILFEDDTYLVVSKPAFIKMHPAHRFQGGSLLNRTIGYLGYAPRLLHRLDMHTTGVVILAKKREVCAPIMRQFERGEVLKQYLCVVDGNRMEWRGEEFEINAPIQRHRAVSFMREIGDTGEDWKWAKTKFRVMDKSKREDMMVLEATPKTGRTHQIRVHAAHAGTPIVGDDLYNPKEHNMYESVAEISRAAKDENLAKYGDGNILRKGLKLHAWKITLIDPRREREMSFTAPPPKHMAELISSVEMEVPTQEV